MIFVYLIIIVNTNFISILYKKDIYFMYGKKWNLSSEMLTNDSDNLYGTPFLASKSFPYFANILTDYITCGLLLCDLVSNSLFLSFASCSWHWSSSFLLPNLENYNMQCWACILFTAIFFSLNTRHINTEYITLKTGYQLTSVYSTEKRGN